MINALTPDQETLRRFSATLFKHADPQGFISLRAFPHRENASAIFIDPIPLGHPQFIDVVCERARQAATWREPAVFCPPVATFKVSQSAAEEDVLEGVTLAAELDEFPSTARSRLVEWLDEPTLAMESGGEWCDPETGEIQPKLHLHWRLRTPAKTAEELKQLREARRLVVNLVGSDPTAKAICHPLRWAGSVHTKGKPRLATIISANENEIDIVDALQALRDAVGASNFQGTTSPNKNAKAANIEDVARALKVIPNESRSWDEWNTFGMATWAASGGSEEGFKAFAIWSAKSAKNDPEATAARWTHYKTSPPNRIGFGTLIFWARHHSPGWTFTGANDVPAAPAADPVDIWAKFDPPNLPRSILPDIIERFAFEQGQAMGADMAGVAVCALTTCAAAIPDKINLQVKRHNTGWLESSRLWTALVGAPSTKKSPIMRAAVRPLQRIDTEMARRYAEERARYDKLPKEEKASAEPPKKLRLLLQDTTIEAAQDILKDSVDGVLCYQDELSGFFGSMDKYSGSRGSAKDRAFWLEAFNGGSYSVSRVSRGDVFIENLSISLIGGIQPEPIRKIADESVDDGLLQRLLPVILKPAVEGRDEELSPSVTEYSELISRLHHLVSPIMGGLDFNSQFLRFDEGAQHYRQELERKHLDLQSCESINRKLAAHIGKYDGIFARLCVVWHCVEAQPGRLPAVITESVARRVGAFLHGFLLPHAMAFYAGVLGLSNNHDKLTAVAGYILSKGLTELSNRDIQRGDSTMRSLERRETDAVCEQLDALGWVNRAPGPRPTSPPRWEVNPAVHSKFAARAISERERREKVRQTIAGMFRKATA